MSEDKLEYSGKVYLYSSGMPEDLIVLEGRTVHLHLRAIALALRRWVASLTWSSDGHNSLPVTVK